MTERKYFGTDGIRGRANTEPMTALTALKVAMAAARYFKRQHLNHRPKVVIGKDTRLSGYMLENAMSSGFLSMGMDVTFVGPMPTPAVAMLTRSMRADLGVMISASHNPYEDNGIKLFGHDGFKLSDAIEREIEQLIDTDLSSELVESGEIGRARRVDEEGGRYVEFVKASFPKDMTLEGLRIVIDCANGAAYKVAPKVLWELGAEIIPMGVQPNGRNINKACGATHTLAMQDAVIVQGAHIGIALDGDADRLIVCDEKGQQLDGDQIAAAIACEWHRQGRLAKDTLVMTVMSSLGMETYLKSQGINLVRASVGDRYVLDEMRKHGYNMGGEQSGHMILSDFCTTGDGLMAALQILAILKRSGKPASEALNVFKPTPQILKNLRFNGNNPLDLPQIKTYLMDYEQQLGSDARILVRKSGTEKLIRVLAEAQNNAQVQQIVNDICSQLEPHINQA
ncbi:MAG TPA: phosphoglucosamine mutase [Alphaproteobacteria bacterium]